MLKYIGLKRLGALALMVVVSSCSNTFTLPDNTLYLLEGTNDSNPDVYADCLGILDNTMTSDQLAKLLSNGGSVSSQGESSKFEIDGKLQPGRYICYTKLIVVKASPNDVKSILDKNVESHASKVNARQRDYNNKIEEDAKRTESDRKRIDALLESAY
jgi:hypothetical protein